MRAARVRPGLDLVEFADQFRDAAGLLLEAHGSGVAVAQGPLAGAVVPKGTQVHVNFRRLSEATESVNAAAVEHP